MFICFNQDHHLYTSFFAGNNTLLYYIDKNKCTQDKTTRKRMLKHNQATKEDKKTTANQNTDTMKTGRRRKHN